jgi:hypothetical protein
MVGQHFLSLVLIWIIKIPHGQECLQTNPTEIDTFPIPKKEEKISCTPDTRVEETKSIDKNRESKLPRNHLIDKCNVKNNL